MIWDKISGKYDRLWVQKYSLSPTRRGVLHKIGRLKAETLLDVGCGTGQLILEVTANYNISCTGIDKSPEMIGQAESKGITARFLRVDVTSEKLSDFFKERFDIITCTHSFPYYVNKKEVLKKLNSVLNDGGMVIFVQAAINNVYDRFVMAAVESTAEKAEYLSKKDFLRLALEHFELEEQFDIKEKWFMPSINGYVLRKRRT